MGSGFQTVFFVVAIVISILNIWDRYFRDRVKKVIHFPKPYKFAFRQQSATRSAACLRWSSRCTSQSTPSQGTTPSCSASSGSTERLNCSADGSPKKRIRRLLAGAMGQSLLQVREGFRNNSSVNQWTFPLHFHYVVGGVPRIH